MKITLFFVIVAVIGMAAAYPAEEGGALPQAADLADVVPRENLAEGVAPADLDNEGAAHFGYGGFRGGYGRRYYGGGYGGGFGFGRGFGGGYYGGRRHYW